MASRHGVREGTLGLSRQLVTHRCADVHARTSRHTVADCTAKPNTHLHYHIFQACVAL